MSRGTVMTRGGIDALKQQLWAEAMRHGLGQAKEVLIIADGALWIWKLAADRFAGARQRLDPWHALEHLWAVAHALHSEDEAAAAAWIVLLAGPANVDDAGTEWVYLSLVSADGEPAALWEGLGIEADPVLAAMVLHEAERE